jgi:hypothetical protein
MRGGICRARNWLAGFGVAIGLLLTAATLAFSLSTLRPQQDGLLKNGPPAWDANRDGVYTCNECKSFVERILVLKANRPDRYRFCIASKRAASAIRMPMSAPRLAASTYRLITNRFRLIN